MNRSQRLEHYSDMYHRAAYQARISTIRGDTENASEYSNIADEFLRLLTLTRSESTSVTQ